MITKQDVIQWLNKQVKIYKMVNECRELNDGDYTFSSEYSCCISDYMAITNIEEVARVLGVKLNVEPFNLEGETEYITRLSFVFKDVTFMSLSSKGVNEFE